MKVNMKLNDNFYKEFGNVSDEVLEYAFSKLTERNMIKVYIYYGEHSKEKKMGTKKALEVKNMPFVDDVIEILDEVLCASFLLLHDFQFSVRIQRHAVIFMLTHLSDIVSIDTSLLVQT